MKNIFPNNSSLRFGGETLQKMKVTEGDADDKKRLGYGKETKRPLSQYLKEEVREQVDFPGPTW